MDGEPNASGAESSMESGVPVEEGLTDAAAPKETPAN